MQVVQVHALEVQYEIYRKYVVTTKGEHLQFKSAHPQLRNIADNRNCGLAKVAELRLPTLKI
jgi:hypothetical protein